MRPDLSGRVGAALMAIEGFLDEDSVQTFAQAAPPVTAAQDGDLTPPGSTETQWALEPELAQRPGATWLAAAPGRAHLGRV